MSRNLIASKLIESVRRRAYIPDDSSEYNDQEVLNIINEEFETSVLPELLELHEEHLVTYTDITPHLVDETGIRYIIPHRAIGSKLRDVFNISGDTYDELSRVDLDEIGDYRSDYGNSGSNLFYVQGDEIIVLGRPFSGTSTLRVYFHIRPNVIVLEKNCMQVSLIDRENGVIQMSSIDKTLFDVSMIDFVQNRNPNKILSIDIPITSINLNTRTVVVNPSSIPDRLMVGDWVCRSEESPFPNVPTEMHKVLAQSSAVKILEDLGDAQNFGIASSTLNKMIRAVKSMMDNRVQGAPRKIKNRYSPLNNSGISGGRKRRGRF